MYNCFQENLVLDEKPVLIDQELLINDWFSGNSEFRRNQRGKLKIRSLALVATSQSICLTNITIILNIRNA